MAVNPLSGKSKLAVEHSTAFINIYEGSVRSGKTVATLIDWIRYIRTAPPGNLLMTGRTERTVINNLVLPIQDMLGRKRVTINRGNGTVNILGREVMLVGANNEQARTKIQGLTLAGAYVDEASTLPESYWNMLTTRLSEDGARMWATCNPEGPRHWFKLKWLDKAKLWVQHDGTILDRNDEFEAQEEGDEQTLSDLHRFSFTLEDNRANLNPKYYRNVMSMYSGLWYERMILGKWSLAEGAIYPMFSIDKHVVSELPATKMVLAVGVDYGDTHPTRGIQVILGVDNNLYFSAEWAPSLDLTHAQRTASLRAFCDKHGWPNYFFADPSAKGFRYQMHVDGLRPVIKANNSHTDGIGLTASLLTAGRLFIHESCTHLINEFTSYVWDTEKTESGKEQPVKVDDDSLDASRYGLLTSRVQWQEFIPDIGERLPEEVAA